MALSYPLDFGIKKEYTKIVVKINKTYGNKN
jgi:hypothetical protein